MTLTGEAARRHAAQEPKVAVATTTINIPHALELMRACDPFVQFFIAGDRKTPIEAAAYVNAIPNATYLSPADQGRWACSELIGWNCIQRRNIAILEALEWGADIIVLWDDDNLPMDTNYFDHFTSRFAYPFVGLGAIGHSYWFDIGQLLRPRARHRGFPYNVKSLWSVKPMVNARIGVCAGLCLGDPDVDAVTRMALGPEVHGVSELVRNGLVVDVSTWTVFNSQNTAFIRELAPFMFMLPGCGRYDDIYASLICQWAMRRRGLHVHFGPPMIWQSRNPHDLMRDLYGEVEGMGKIKKLAEFLSTYKPDSEDGLVGALRPFLPSETMDAMLAWQQDVGEAL